MTTGSVQREIKRSDGTATRKRLLRAGEALFAASGVEVPLSELQRAAGLRNNSALQYYFGSRDGLLDAILDRHQKVIDAERHNLLAGLPTDGRSPDLGAFVRALVVPGANRLRTTDGRDYLLILPQVVHRMDVSRAEGTMPEALQRTLDGIEHALDVTTTNARARAGLAAVMNAAALADRARQINARQRRTSHNEFVGTLVSMLIGALAGSTMR